MTTDPIPTTLHAVRLPPKRPGLLRRSLFPLGMTVATIGVFWMMAGHAISRGDVEQLPPETPRGSTNPKAVAVTVSPVVVRPIQRTLEVVGTLYGYEEVTLRAKVEGRVKRILHDVSDRVNAGEPLVELDPIDAELAVKQAEKNLLTDLARLGLTAPPAKEFDVLKLPVVAQAQVRLENSRGKAERASTLAKRNVISAEELAERTTEYRAAEAELANQILLANAGLATVQLRQESLRMVKQQLDDTIVRAPTPSQPPPGGEERLFAVTKRSVSEGALVRIGDEVCTLVIDRTLKLRVDVPERYSAEVKLGQKADVSTSAFVTPFEGKVSRINPSVDPVTRTFEVEVLCRNDDGKLKPGGFAKAAIATRYDEKATMVPIESIVTFAGISKVFLLDGEQVREVRITPGVQETNWVEAASPPIPADSQVVTSGQTVLADGTPVFVRPTVSKR